MADNHGRLDGNRRMCCNPTHGHWRHVKPKIGLGTATAAASLYGIRLTATLTDRQAYNIVFLFDSINQVTVLTTSICAHRR